MLMELTAPRWWDALKVASLLRALTSAWQSSKTPRTAMLWMLASWSVYIWARCTGLIRPAGESMKTLTPSCPLKACSAAEPVSPEVAPRMLRT